MITVTTHDTGARAFAPRRRTRPGLAAPLALLVARIRSRCARNRAYRDLLSLDDHLLDDVGLTYGQVAAASAAGRDPLSLVKRNLLKAAGPR